VRAYYAVKFFVLKKWAGDAGSSLDFEGLEGQKTAM